MDRPKGEDQSLRLSSPSPSSGKYFIQTYATIRDLYARVAEDTTEAYREGRLTPSEKDLYAVWMGRHISTEGLKTTGGVKLKIIAPGWWNPGPGPDFSRAEILLDGRRRYKGDVEIHLRSSDWQAHGHHTDKAYNRVILHVVLRHERNSRAPLRQDGEPVPELALTDYLTGPLSDIIGGKAEEPSPSGSETGRCSSILSSWSTEKAGALFDLAGDERALLKARRIGQDAALNGYPQATYRATMEALGYAPNRVPFGELAQLLTEETLYHQISNTRGCAEETLLEALYFGVGNLFPRQVPIADSDEETDSYLTELLDIWGERAEGTGVSVMESGEWSLKGLRPANHPRRRLSGMSRLMVRLREKGIFGALLEQLKEGRSEDDSPPLSDRVGRMFTVPAEGYWGGRYNFGAKRLNRPQSLIGKERVEIVLVNAAIPALLAYSRSEGLAEVEANLQRLYSALPPSPLNRRLRFMAARLFGGKTFPTQLKLNARRQQGLIQIYNDFCGQHEGGCGDCLFPELLRHL
jgi:hypothetical protein